MKAELDRQRAELAALIKQAQETAERGQRLEALISRVGMRQALSALLVFASFFIIMSNQYGPESEKWAFGTIGTLPGSSPAASPTKPDVVPAQGIAAQRSAPRGP